MSDSNDIREYYGKGSTVVSVVDEHNIKHYGKVTAKLGMKEVVKSVKITLRMKQKVFLWKISIAKGLQNITQTRGTI